MAWTAPRTWTTGEVLTAALLNTHLRDDLLETAPAKVTTAGDLVRATGANALARIAIGATNQALRVIGGVPAWDSLTGMTPAASNAAAQTTTSTSAVDLLTLTPATAVPIGDWALLCFEFRKTATAANGVAFGLKVNATTVLEAQYSTAPNQPRSSQTNRAEAGFAHIWIPPRSTANYGFGVLAQFACFTTAGVWAASSYQDHAAALNPVDMTAAIPQAAISSVTIRAINNGSNNNAEVRAAALYALRG